VIFSIDAGEAEVGGSGVELNGEWHDDSLMGNTLWYGAQQRIAAIINIIQIKLLDFGRGVPVAAVANPMTRPQAFAVASNNVVVHHVCILQRFEDTVIIKVGTVLLGRG